MSFTKDKLQKLIKESIAEELKKEGVGDFLRSISGRDVKYFNLLKDLTADKRLVGNYADMLRKNEKFFREKRNYEAGGPLNNSVLYALNALNKGVKGYGRGKTVDDVFNAVQDAYGILGSS